MKTIKTKSYAVLENAFYNYDEIDALTNELLLYIRNDERLNTALIESRRTKIHSIAFNSMIAYAVEIAGDIHFQKRNLYISSPQLKAFILEKWGMDYKELLQPLCKELEEIRNNYL